MTRDDFLPGYSQHTLTHRVRDELIAFIVLHGPQGWELRRLTYQGRVIIDAQITRHPTEYRADAAGRRQARTLVLEGYRRHKALDYYARARR